MIVTKIKKFNYRGFSLEKLHYMQSFDFDINFIVGGRYNHKSSTVQCEIIDNCMNKDEIGIRVVRYKDDRSANYVKDFFQPYVEEYALKNYNAYLEYYAGAYYLYWYNSPEDREAGKKPTKKKLFMKIVDLNSHQKFKSQKLENASIIMYDEFAPEETTVFIKNEPRLLTKFIATVNRKRKTGALKVYLIGNMISVDNIYFDYYGIDAYELTTYNIYDYSIEGYQRVGVYVVESVNESFESAARILRTYERNVEETKQDSYSIPDTIIGINDIFMFLLVYDKEAFDKRFKIKYIIDVTNLDNHESYICLYIDKYNDRIVYAATTKQEKSDVYISFPDNYLYEHSTHTIVNSKRELPVFRGFSNLKEFRYLDRQARTTVKQLIDNRLIL